MLYFVHQVIIYRLSVLNAPEGEQADANIKSIYNLEVNTRDLKFQHTFKSRKPWKSLEMTKLELRPYLTNNATYLTGMKICFVTEGLSLGLNGGGIGQAVYRQVVLFHEQGAKVDVVYTGRIKLDPVRVGSFERSGISIQFVKTTNSNAYGSDHMKRGYNVFQWFRDKNATNYYDIIMFHDMHGHGNYVMFSKHAGIDFQNTTMIVHAHGSTRLSDFFNAHHPPKGGESLVTYGLERQSLELADIVISPSEFYFSWMVNQGYTFNQRQKLWTLGLMVPKYSKSRNRHGLRITSDKFVFAGRLDRLKGLFVFLDALDTLAQGHGHKPSHILFAGYSVDLKLDERVINSIEYITEREKMWPFNVTITTNMSTTQLVDKILAENFIYVNPTSGETASTVTIEMLSYGVPIISSNVCALPELFGNLSQFKAWSFHRNDHLALSELMQKAMTTGVVVSKPRLQPTEANQLYLAAMKRASALSKQNVRPKNTTEFRLSICIATSNRADYLADLIQSLLHQNYIPGNNTEIIILHLGMKDISNVTSVLAQFSHQLESLKFHLKYKHSDRVVHVSQARNLLMDIATGTHLLFIDDDDVATPHMIDLFTTAALHSGADVVTGFAQTFHEENGNRTLKHISLSGGALKESMAVIHHAGKSNMMVRKSAMVAVGGCSVDELNSPTPFVDWDLYNKLMANGAKIIVVPEVTFYYRMSSRNSIYYRAMKRKDLIYYGHHKRAKSLCNAYNIPMDVCAGLGYVLQELSLPSAL